MKSKKEKYKMKIVESSSPLTKRPSTPFRLAALGLKEIEICREEKDTSPTDIGVSNAADSLVYPKLDSISCTSSITGGSITGQVGRLIEFTIDHGENSEMVTSVETATEGFVIESSDGRYFIKGNNEGTFDVSIVVYYNYCPTCTLSLNVTLEAGGTTGVTPEPEGDVPTSDRTCDDIFEDGKVDHYKGLDDFKWKLDPTSNVDIDNNISIKYGEGTTLEGADFWTGLEYIYTSYWIKDNNFTPNEEVPRMVYGFREAQKPIEDVVMGFVKTPIAETWEEFHNTAYANYGLTECASSVDKASLWASSQLGLPVIIDDDAKWITESPILETVVKDFKAIHINKLVNILRVRDIMQDSGNTTTGAFVSDSLDLKEHLGFMNMEPQLQTYDFDTNGTFFPMDYVASSGATEWYDYTNVPNADYVNYHYNSDAYTDKEKLALVSGSVAIHELAHALDNRYYDFKGVKITDEQGWLDLSGWGAMKPDGTYPKMIKTSGSTKKFPVTPYGCHSPGEDFAEAYAIYKYNPEFLCFYHPEKFCYIQEKERELFNLLGETPPQSEVDCGCGS